MQAANTGWRVAVQLILTLGVGLGAIVALASLMEATVFTPLRLPCPNRLVIIQRTDVGHPNGAPLFPAGPYIRWQASGLAPFTDFGLAMPAFDEAIQADGTYRPATGALLSMGAFRAAGVKPLLGRGFNRSDLASIQTHVFPVLISASVWKHDYHQDPAILGRVMKTRQNGLTALARIVGVMPAAFAFPYPYWPFAGVAPRKAPDVWHLYANPKPNPEIVNMGLGVLVARLRPGWTVAAAQAAMNVAWKSVQHAVPAMASSHLLVSGFAQKALGGARRTLEFIFAALALIFLLACVSLTNLIALAWARRRYDFSIRVALGARLSSLARHWLGEILALTTAGCLLGAGLAYMLLRLMAVAIPRLGYSLPFLSLPPVDTRLFFPLAAFALITAAGWTMLLLLRERRQSVWRALSHSGASSSGSVRNFSITSFSVMAQTAVSVVLAVVAVAAVLAFRAKADVQLGPEPNHLYSLFLSTRGRDPHWNTDAGVRAFMRSFSTRMSALPGTQAVAFAEEFPPMLDPESYQAYRGNTKLPPLAATSPQIVSSNFFSIAGVPLLSGRSFSSADVNGPKVAVVNAAFAHEFWPSTSALGRRFITQHNNAFTVVGVVANYSGYWLAPATPQVYIAQSQTPEPLTVVVRSRAPEAVIGAAARALAARTDSYVQLDAPHSLEYGWSRTVTRPRLQMSAMLLFAFLAVLLAVQGIFAAVSLDVRGRRRESAIRSVLGASHRAVAWSLVSGTAALTAIGFALACLALLLLQHGLAAHLALTPGMLWGVAVPCAALVLALVLLAGSYGPLRRGARAEPMDILREG